MTIRRFEMGDGKFCRSVPALLWEMKQDADGRLSKYRLVFSNRKPASMRGVYKYTTFGDFLTITSELRAAVQELVGRYTSGNRFYILYRGRKALQSAKLWGKSGYVWVEEAE